MTGAYLSRLPLKFMRSSAGFSPQGGDYFIPRAEFDPPQTLQRLVFPWLEKWELRFRNARMNRKWNDGGLHQTDLAGAAFVRVMLHLRVVLLQDLAFLHPRKWSCP
jgi:hypothetical protein